MSEVADWLSALGMSEYAERFAENRIDLSVLPDLTDQDLEKLGVVLGYQRMVARAGVAAKFTFLVHSHMLRHACGFKLANDGHDTRAIQAYLGHRSIMSTVRYTALTPNRFKHFWKD
jgi:site-specific recombinase XerD